MIGYLSCHVTSSCHVMSCHVTSSCHVMSCDFVHQKKLSCWKKGTKAVKLVETLSLRRKKKKEKKKNQLQ